MKIRHLIIIAVLAVSCGKATKETTPQRKDLTEMVFASGVLEAEDQYNLTAQTDGYLVKLNFKEGDAVTAGQLLAVIDNNQNIINSQSAAELHNIAESNTRATAPALLQIEANIEAARAKYKQDQQQADRYKRLYDEKSVSKLEYENAQLTAVNSKASMDALQQQYSNQQLIARQQEITQRSASNVNQVMREQNQVKAINTGKIYEKKKQLGDYVKKGDVIAVIGNPDIIYAKLNVDETNMSKIKIGQETAIRLNTNRDKVYKANVHIILPAFDVVTQSFLVKAYFNDSLDFRITGTQLEANVIVGESKHALVIPRSYLGYGNMVLLKKDKKQVAIKTGVVSDEWVEVLSGLTEQDVIISDDKK
jgi:multidrug efflux pump subunit AcrA (membrane-fusion protein)